MSLEEGASIWDDNMEEAAAAGPSDGDRSRRRGTDISSDAHESTQGQSQKASPLFDDIDAGWGSSETPAEQTKFGKDEMGSSQNTAIADEARHQSDEARESISASKDHAHLDPPESSTKDGVEDSFDDSFDEPMGTTQAIDDDEEEGDDFGEFGDFDEGQNEEDAFGDVEEDVAGVDSSSAAAAHTQTSSMLPMEQADWAPLHLDKDTEPDEIASRIRQILSAPLGDGRAYPYHDGAMTQLSNDRVRQVDGPAQVLVTDESRKAWSALSAPPELKTVDWLRSKTRRTYLIAMGVPINLDELSTSADSAKRLPPLTLKYDSKAERGIDARNGAAHTPGSPYTRSEAGHSAKSRESSKAPEMDTERAKHLIGLSEDDLTLLALPALRDVQREMEQMARQASGLLTHYLQLRDAHGADAEMYNGLIRDLVTGAAKRVGGTGSNASAAGSIRRTGTPRSSAARVAASAGSGRNSPASIGGRG